MSARQLGVSWDERSEINLNLQINLQTYKLQINTFAIGVTDHVLASELETIAGSSQHWFYVDRFKVRRVLFSKRRPIENVTVIQHGV